MATIAICIAVIAVCVSLETMRSMWVFQKAQRQMFRNEATRLRRAFEDSSIKISENEIRAIVRLYAREALREAQNTELQ